MGGPSRFVPSRLPIPPPTRVSFRSELDSGGHHYIAGWIAEPQRSEALQPAQASYVESWFDWSKVSVIGGIIDELRKTHVAPTIEPTTTHISSSIGELGVHRVREGRAFSSGHAVGRRHPTCQAREPVILG